MEYFKEIGFDNFPTIFVLHFTTLRRTTEKRKNVKRNIPWIRWVASFRNINERIKTTFWTQQTKKLIETKLIWPSSRHHFNKFYRFMGPAICSDQIFDFDFVKLLKKSAAHIPIDLFAKTHFIYAQQFWMKHWIRHQNLLMTLQSLFIKDYLIIGVKSECQVRLLAGKESFCFFD